MKKLKSYVDMYIEEDADTYEKVDDSDAEREEYWKGMENDK